MNKFTYIVYSLIYCNSPPYMIIYKGTVKNFGNMVGFNANIWLGNSKKCSQSKFLTKEDLVPFSAAEKVEADFCNPFPRTM